jgi:hypothetical protein
MNSSLDDLSLEDIHDDGAQAFFAAFEQQTTLNLKSLRISCSSLSTVAAAGQMLQ